jgi:NDP-sugar pyrophosphorylase family protein
MINVVIPMAGAGSRFSRAGFIKPKPFIDVGGKPMIVRVLENLAIPNAHFILVARREHLQAEATLVQEIESNFKVTFIEIDGLTEGTACTVLHARKMINNATPLLIANSDQLVDFNPLEFVEDCLKRNLDGSILTFVDAARDPKWSFARIGEDGLVQEVREKQAISELATVGIYLFSKGSDFVDASIEMILRQDRINNEYYTCPSYNYLIERGLKICVYSVAEEEMHGIGTPEDLAKYLKINK